MPYIQIPAHDGGETFKAYIAQPENIDPKSPPPCVIVIQEIFGVNQGIREKCDWLASEGFMACAPDLFWRIEPNIELSDHVEDELKRAFELFGEFDIENGMKDIQSTINHLRNLDQCGEKIGALGYCLGGKLAYLTACHTGINATIGYYGVGIEALLADANNMTSPLMLHIAEEDGFVPPEAQTLIHQGLSGNEYVTLHSYAGVDHAFTRQNGEAYDAQAAKIADQRSIDFLKTHLTCK